MERFEVYSSLHYLASVMDRSNLSTPLRKRRLTEKKYNAIGRSTAPPSKSATESYSAKNAKAAFEAVYGTLYRLYKPTYHSSDAVRGNS